MPHKLNKNVDITKTITHVSLCAGYGGIDLGLKRAIPNLRTIAFSEIEAFACANLVSKMETGLLDAAPIWTNLKTFPWAEFRGVVDILSGGFPCQPFSSAGKRAGDEDPRHLFPYILDGIRRCRPSVVFLENVAGILSSTLAGDGWRDPAGTPVLLHVFRELERVGYKSTAGIFSASEVGAVHQRKRVFILSISNGIRGKAGFSGSEQGDEGVTGEFNYHCSKAIPSRPGQPQFPWEPPRVVANSNKQRRGGRGDGDEGELCREVQTTGSCASEVGNPSSQGLADTGGSGSMDEKGRVPEDQGCEPAPTIEQSSSACGAEELGNTGHEQPQRWHGSSDGQQPSGWRVPRGESTPCSRASDESPQLGNSASLRPCGGGKDGSGEQPEVFRTGSEYSTDQRKTQPSVGGDPNGLANRVGHAELRQPDHSDCGADSDKWRELADSVNDGCHHANSQPIKHGVEGALGEETTQQTRRDRIHRPEHGQAVRDGQLHPNLYTTCDNRTDELRLLGNGVYPDTASLAWRTLWRELTA